MQPIKMINVNSRRSKVCVVVRLKVRGPAYLSHRSLMHMSVHQDFNRFRFFLSVIMAECSDVQ